MSMIFVAKIIHLARGQEFNPSLHIPSRYQKTSQRHNKRNNCLLLKKLQIE